MAQPTAQIPVLILKEGTQRTTGRDARKANIYAARVIAEALASSLGPRGMDKLLVDSFGNATITGDGATILKEMEVQHPAAKMLVEVAKAQDDEVGDGTTSVVVLAGQLLSAAEELLDEDVHPAVITEGFEKALVEATRIIDEVAEKVDPLDRSVLEKIAQTALSSKVVAEFREFLSKIMVDAALQVVEKRDGSYKLSLDDIKVEKKKGESITETILVKGIVLDKEVVHPAMPKRVEKAKIALLDAPLEIEKPEWTAKINVTTPEQLKMFLDQEAEILRKKVEKIKESGANVVFCQKGIDDVAQYYLAKAGILAVRRVKKSDMEKLARATGAKILTRVEDVTPEALGTAELVEERKVADEKMVFVEGCPNPKSVTILVRGGAEHIVDEAERAIHDGLSVIRNVIQEPKIVAGGGAVEIELAMRLRDFARTLPSKEQLAVMKYAEALENLVAILAQNSGVEPIDILADLKRLHSKGEKWAGINAYTGKIEDMLKAGIIEPAIVKKQVLKSATEAAIMILRIDDIIAAQPPKGKEKGKEKGEKGESEFD
ncbi:TCP-1/cpn60 chaperonin family protein [Infirmifilum lucidum]|uniref:TCP-1/cpn60 chaperonin family protein n=1 Tax=Infirmifilum lucidum TaxID=2776706 RepID=A0A7L9FF78_9CREN|nr:thermosome subunit alpha [Infirmifilum lucidum]QOJ78337.1 TCP-1/cpn60 chaperonin family protein [Infirmifilum lucidum]